MAALKCTDDTEFPMTRFVLLLIGIALLASPAPAPAQNQDGAQGSAQSSPPGAEDNRYSFHRIGEAFVRLDSRTGQVAQCGWSASGWSCSAVPDERAALESEIARLQQENVALKKSLLSRGIELPGGVKPDPPAIAKTPEQEPSLKLPTEADLDRAVAFMKDVWRRLVEMMVELQRDIQRKS
jgi:hypothetical protein